MVSLLFYANLKRKGKSNGSFLLQKERGQNIQKQLFTCSDYLYVGNITTIYAIVFKYFA